MIESICYFRSSNEGRRVSFVKEKRKKKNIRSTLNAVENSRVVFFKEVASTRKGGRRWI